MRGTVAAVLVAARLLWAGLVASPAAAGPRRVVSDARYQTEGIVVQQDANNLLRLDVPGLSTCIAGTVADAGAFLKTSSSCCVSMASTTPGSARSTRS